MFATSSVLNTIKTEITPPLEAYRIGYIPGTKPGTFKYKSSQKVRNISLHSRMKYKVLASTQFQAQQSRQLFIWFSPSLSTRGLSAFLLG